MLDEKVDVFDNITKLPVLQLFDGIYKKYKEGILYLFFGGITFFIVISIFIVLSNLFAINVLISNVLSWLSGVIFSFFATRKWVFKVKVVSFKETIYQMGVFCFARLLTLVLQEILIFIFVLSLECNSVLIKVLTEFINIVLNYLVSKFVIFRR